MPLPTLDQPFWKDLPKRDAEGETRRYVYSFTKGSLVVEIPPLVPEDFDDLLALLALIRRQIEIERQSREAFAG